MSIVIADTGALISLAHVDKIELIESVFGKVYIPNAVWEEIIKYEYQEFDKSSLLRLEKNIIHIKSKNHLSVIMDYGEAESVILYEEINADYLLIDDNRARNMAESLGVNCIGSIGLLIKSKQLGFIKEIRPIFHKWIKLERYFSIKLLNSILKRLKEPKL